MAPQQQQKQPSAAQLEAVKSSVRALLSQPSYDDGSIGPVLVRLAWHAAGTYCATTGTGGSNGAGMRWEAEGGDPANAGLSHARAFLEPVKREHPWITYSDLWTLASVVAIEEMGGPTAIPWKGGRTDFYSETDKRVPPRGRLPDAAHATPADHLREVFGRMGFGDREIVALSGAHNLGRCHGDRSGFVGKWVNNPTRFSNQYFRLLSKMEWKEVTLESGVRQFSYVDEDAAEEGEEGLMMLPTDMALLSDDGFRPWVDRYAADKDLFFADFEAAFSKLLELGLRRHPVTGRVLNDEIDAAGGEEEAGYWTAPKKSDRPTAKL